MLIVAGEESKDPDPTYSVEDCMEQARRFIEDAAAELDGTEHPALFDVVQGCSWLLQALEQRVARETKGSG